MESRTQTVDEYIASRPDWQRRNLELFRDRVGVVVPDVSEAIKWGVPVFVCQGKTLLAMATFKDLREGEQLDADGLEALIRRAYEGMAN